VRQSTPFRLLALLAVFLCLPVAATASMEAVDGQVAAHPGQSGVYVLETGTEALIARAWLVDNARTSIEAQYCGLGQACAIVKPGCHSK